MHVLDSIGRTELTKEDEDRIFDAVMDPATRNRRYGYGNLEVILKFIIKTQMYSNYYYEILKI